MVRLRDWVSCETVFTTLAIAIGHAFLCYYYTSYDSSFLSVSSVLEGGSENPLYSLGLAVSLSVSALSRRLYDELRTEQSIYEVRGVEEE